MKKFLLLIGFTVFFISLVTVGFSQSDETANHAVYTDALGIRIGPTSPAIQNGITYKHFLNESNALEGILSLTNGFGICGLYEIHKPLPVENVQWYIGAGGYVAFVNSNNYFGGAGIIGVDYSFTNIPLNISIDWKPELNLAPRISPELSGVGFSARYTFGK